MYGALETSVASGVPIELYEFTYGDTTQCFTSSDTNVTIGTTTYVASQISRSEVVESSEIGKNNVTLTCPDQFPVSLLFQSGPPDGIVTVVIKAVQQAELLSADTQVIWKGRITTVDFPPLRSEITCEAVFTSLRVAGIHRIFTINCPFELYGSECKVVQSSFLYTTTRAVTQNLNVFSGAALTGKPNGWFSGGILVWSPSTGIYITRGIKTHIVSGGMGTIEVTYGIPSFPSAGAIVSLYPGCDHSFYTCINKFDNQPNYGGFPYMTQKNPWGSASVF